MVFKNSFRADALMQHHNIKHHERWLAYNNLFADEKGNRLTSMFCMQILSPHFSIMWMSCT